jgi:hypothetical protein
MEDRLTVVEGFLIDPEKKLKIIKLYIYVHMEKSPNDYQTFFHPTLSIYIY